MPICHMGQVSARNRCGVWIDCSTRLILRPFGRLKRPAVGSEQSIGEADEEDSVFRRRRKGKEFDRFAEELAVARQEDEQLAKEYMGGDKDVLDGMNGQLNCDPWDSRATLPTLHLATSVVRYALRGDDFHDLSDALKRGRVSDPYDSPNDLGFFLRAYDVTFGELVEATLVVTEAAGIEGFHDPAMLEHLAAFADEPVDHVDWVGNHQRSSKRR